MGRTTLAGVIGGAVVFAWGAFSHMVLPLHTNAMQPMKGTDSQMKRVLHDPFEGPGIYHYPGFPVHDDGSPPTQEELDATFEKMRSGPVISFLVIRDRAEPFPPLNFAITFAVDVLACLLAAVLLSLAVERLREYSRRVYFVLAIGVIIFCFELVPAGVWFGYPLPYWVAQGVDIFASWFLAGIVLGAIIRPSAAAAAVVRSPVAEAPTDSRAGD